MENICRVVLCCLISCHKTDNGWTAMADNIYSVWDGASIYLADNIYYGMVPLFVTQNQAIIVIYEQACVWQLKTRLLWVGGSHKPCQAIHLGERKLWFETPLLDKTCILTTGTWSLVLNGLNRFLKKSDSFWYNLYKLSTNYLKMIVYMHLYKAICTVKLHFIYLHGYGVFIWRQASPVTWARWLCQADFTLWQAGSPKTNHLKFTFSQETVMVMHDPRNSSQRH
jgi:hypothetical protein